MTSSQLFKTAAFVPLLLLLCSCSSGISVTTSRLAGIVVDKGIAVEVGVINGDKADKFRDALLSAVRSQKEFGSSRDSLSFAVLLIEGTYATDYHEDAYEEQSGDEKKQMVRRTYTARFSYRILDDESREPVIDGILEESDSNNEEPERSFLGSVLRAITEAIFDPDPYSSPRERLVNRVIGEISPHEMKVDVVLFEDSDMPELRTGIQFARTGRWKEALGIFLDAIEKHAGHKNLHKAYYDAGVAYEYDHQYSYAREFLERALRISNEDAYANELFRCGRYEQEWRWREGYLEKLKMMEGRK